MKKIDWKDLALRMVEDFNDWDCFVEDTCKRVTLQEYNMILDELDKIKKEKAK